MLVSIQWHHLQGWMSYAPSNGTIWNAEWVTPHPIALFSWQNVFPSIGCQHLQGWLSHTPSNGTICKADWVTLPPMAPFAWLTQLHSIQWHHLQGWMNYAIPIQWHHLQGCLSYTPSDEDLILYTIVFTHQTIITNCIHSYCPVIKMMKFSVKFGYRSLP